MAAGAIGLDIGSSGLRAAELSFRRGQVTLERLGQAAVPPGAVRDGEVVDGPAVTAALKQLWKAERFSTRRVHLGVANPKVIVREVEIPDLPRAEMAAALPFQVQDVLPIPVETAILDFHPLERTTSAAGPRVRGMLVAASREMVTANVAAVEAAGLVVQSVDLTPFALLRSVGSRFGEETGVEAIVDIGARITNIVVHTAGVPRFVRIMLRGGQDVTDALSEHLGMDVAEADALKHASSVEPGGTDLAARALAAGAQQLIDEVRGSLDYYASSHPSGAVERIVLSGGGAQLGGLAEELAAATRLPVVAGEPVGRVGFGGVPGRRLTDLSALAAVPVGLAMGAAL